MNLEMLERTGPNFTRQALMIARGKTHDAIRLIGERIKPGITEDEARQIAKTTLTEMGSTSGWHKILIRFGSNTIKDFVEPSEEGVRLRDNDIFFIDIGPIWDGTEGDGGDTFVIGDSADPDMARCATAAKQIFGLVRGQWLQTGMNGIELYEFAQKATADLGWVLNMGLTGHRLGDFPHKAFYDGTLGRVPIHPAPALWILEIQIRHPTKPFGGFFEDLLLTSDV
jgi:Xaa-Pro aminopeptidase